MPDQRTARLLLTCSFLTGFSALLYETVWQRVLGFFSGSDVLSATLVISAYLSGLAVGSLIGALFADRIRDRRLVLWYSALTLLVGVFGCASTPLFYNVVYLRLGVHAFPVAGTYAVLFLALMAPTATMGASFPLLGRILVGKGTATAPATLAVLNGVNILGAVLGSLVSGWYLIGTLGYDRTTFVGATFDVAAAGLALAAVRRREPSADAGVAGSTPASAATRSLRSALTGEVRVWAGLTVVSGFIAVSLEIVWLRLLSIYIKSNSYLFAHLIAWVLLGFALGSVAGVRVLRRFKNAQTVFLWSQIAVVVYALASNLVMALFYPAISGRLGTGIIELNPGHGWVGVATNLGRYVGVPLFILFPPTFLIGLTFPCAQQAIRDTPSLVGARVGVIQLATLLGNIAGGLVTGLWLLDQFGSFVALRILGGIALVFVLALWAGAGRRGSPGERWRAAGAAAALLALIVLYPGTRRLFAQMHNVERNEPFHYSEDASGISTLTGIGAPTYSSLMLNVDAIAESQLPFNSFHCYLGAIGTLIHPAPISIFVIGIGAGSTPYCIGIDDRVRLVRAVEVVSSELKVVGQIKGSRLATPVDDMMRDPRYDIRSGDARKDLTSRGEKYDVIESDAIKPRRPHSGILYSAEFFQMVRTRLKPGGLFVQWEASPRVKATMLSVFPYVVSFNHVIVGSDSPLRIDRERVLARLADPAAARYMAPANDPNSPTPLVTFIRRDFSETTFEYWMPSDARGTLDVNTDLRPKDEFYMNNHDGTAPVRSRP